MGEAAVIHEGLRPPSTRHMAANAETSAEVSDA